MSVPCKHWSACNVHGGGCCAKGLYGGKPSAGVCLRVCPEYDGPPRESVTLPKVRPGVGVGSLFRNMVAAKYGVTGCLGCDEAMVNMNTLGPDGCARERDAILEDIWTRRDELKGWRRLAAKFPGAKTVALAELGELFDQAVSEARAHSTS